MYTSVINEFSTGALASWAATGFIVGAFFVLFSTVLAGAAGGARLLTDAFCVMRLIDPADYPARQKSIRILICVSLVTATTMYSMFTNPPLMLMIASLVSVVFYPALALGTIWLRHRRVDKRILPSKPTTIFLWICGFGSGSDFARRRDLRPGTEEWLVAVAGLAAGLATLKGEKNRAALSVGSISVDRMCSRDIIGTRRSCVRHRQINK
ncbi:MAG: hypothetical protein Ct9H300mP1_16210 [Planctomycetaceae bacterium]|nr:MAG: hypothetical protein Ct9H300mP1_16210 [Planctomycetaceae bacterium]